MTIRTRDRLDADLDIASSTVGGEEVPVNQLANAAGALIDPATDAMLAAISAKLPALVAGGLRLAGYDASDDMLKVKSVQKKWRDSFAGASLNLTKWEAATIGTGGAVTVSGGLLTMGSGTTINSTTFITTLETFTIPFRVNLGLTLSQRIANQSFIVEAISVDPVTGVPDGQHSIGLVWDGTTATQAKYSVQNSGVAPLVSAASTFPTSASGAFYELEPFSDECWFHGGTLDAATGRANSYRRHQQIPEPNAVFKIRLRWLNGGTAPASNTNAVLQYLTVQDYAELTAEITAGRGNTAAGQGMAAHVVNSISLASNTPTLAAGTNRAGFVAGAGIWYDDSAVALAANATFTGTARDATVAATAAAFANAATYAKEVRISAESDQSGTLWLEVSRDNTNWRRVKSVATAAVPGGGHYAEIVHRPSWRYWRDGFTNGATLQARFSIGSVAMAL